MVDCVTTEPRPLFRVVVRDESLQPGELMEDLAPSCRWETANEIGKGILVGGHIRGREHRVTQVKIMREDGELFDVDCPPDEE